MHRAYAKINLGLRILGRRDDGYHDIETVFHRIALHDEIELEAAPALSVESSDPAAPGGEENICHRAALLVRERLGADRGASIRIRKNIPVGAGLGGGSADAALVLRELPRIWGLSTTDETLRDLALQLGSDVPYFLGTGSALARGRGERLEYVRLEIPYAILLCYPGINVSTGWAYRTLSVPPAQGHPDPLQILRRGLEHPDVLRRMLVNDFEPTVFAAHPGIRRVKERMLENGALYASMSGSGSSVFGFFPDEASARGLAAHFARERYSCDVTPPGFIPA